MGRPDGHPQHCGAPLDGHHRAEEPPSTGTTSTVEPPSTGTPTTGKPPSTPPVTEPPDAGEPKPPVPGGDGLPPIIIGISLAFGNVHIGQTVTKNQEFANPDVAGEPDLTIRVTAVTVTSEQQPSAFRVKSGSCDNAVLAAGANCFVSIDFSPYAERTFKGFVIVHWEYVRYAGGNTFRNLVIGSGVSSAHSTQSSPPVVGKTPTLLP